MSEPTKSSGHLVVTIGAGPAGIYGVRKLAEAGHEVVIINRDIKPGGLVEYGIYFNKHKLKEGVRIQFRKILADPRVQYLGHIKIGAQADLTLDELREVLNPSAVVVACGAQGTKALGIPGDIDGGRLPRQGSGLLLQRIARIQKARFQDRRARGDHRRGQRDGRRRALAGA